MDKGITIKKIIIIVLLFMLALPVASFLGAALLGASYLLPVKGIEDRMNVAAGIMEKEGVRPTVLGSTTDNHTDSLILLEAAYDGRQAKKESAMTVPNRMITNTEPIDSLIGHYQNETEFDTVYEYPRYWHGTIPILKILLQFLSYKGIRILNAVFILLSSMAVMYILCKKNYIFMLPPYLAVLVASNPVAVSSSLQFSPCFYLMQLGIVLVIYTFNDEVKLGGAFFLTGILTAYLDLFTYPLVPVGVMLIFAGVSLLCTHGEENVPFWRLLLRQVKNAALWGFGYAGMWVLKWVIATLYLHRDVLADAKEAFIKRSGDYDYFDQTTITVFDSLYLNIKAFFENKTVYAACIIFAICTVAILYMVRLGCFKKNVGQVCSEINESVNGVTDRYVNEAADKNNSDKTRRICSYITLVVAGLLPFIWYMMILNHSGTHYWMTNRNLLVTLLAICTFVELKLFPALRDNRE